MTEPAASHGPAGPESKIGPGRLIAVVGPSGAGKDTLLELARAELEGDRGVVFPRRVITRTSGNGEEHDSLTVGEFDRAAADGAFAFFWQAHGLSYGVSADVDTALHQGRTIVCNVSRAIVPHLRQRYANLSVVLITAPVEVLAKRLAARGREAIDAVTARLARAPNNNGLNPDRVIQNMGTARESARELIDIIAGKQTTPSVIAVSLSSRHTFSKPNCAFIRLLAGLGVEGDAHCGTTVKHRSRWARDPSQPNLRQVHLLAQELQDELRASGFAFAPGEIGENITTRGIDLLWLPAGTRLQIGADAVIEVTGLRNPCTQLDRFQPGLMAALLDRDETGMLIRKAGVMAIVVHGGDIYPGDKIDVRLPAPPHLPLKVV